MSRPVIWPTEDVFFPVGNTAPICLTNYLPPEEDARVLLLGCGDPRNILYTLYESGSDDSNSKRKMDFTCCDYEPAILARNILLLTLVVDMEDGFDANVHWNIFYHLLIDDASNSRLVNQSQKLADLAISMEQWNASKYSRFLRMGNRYTLSKLRLTWIAYAQSLTRPYHAREAFKRQFVAAMHATKAQHGSSAGSMRSAGHQFEAAEVAVTRAHGQYWKTGLCSFDPRVIAQATNVNPTFALTKQGEGFATEFSTSPLSAFHLAPSYCANPRKYDIPTVEDIFEAAKEQFQVLCATWRKCTLTHQNVVVRFILGDALAICHTLLYHSLTGKLTAHFPVMDWCAASLTLDGGDYEKSASTSAPSKFNVIDSSNLADHLGMLNILVSTVPLLDRSPFATIRTETLWVAGKDPTALFATRLFTDITTFSVLMDLAPLPFISGFDTRSSIHEVICQRTSIDFGQYHEPTVWKIPSLLSDSGNNGVITLDPKSLARLLFNMYLKMVVPENVNTMTNLMSEINKASLTAKTVVQYSRLSLVLFLKYLASRIKCDWKEVMDAFHALEEKDTKTFRAMTFYQEMICHLQLHQVYSHDSLVPNHWSLRYNEHVNHGISRFVTWKDLPAIVCVVFMVPRAIMQKLEGGTFGSPNLIAYVVGETRVNRNGVKLEGWRNSFSVLHTAFGHVALEGSGENARVRIFEDPHGKSGGSSAIVAFWVPIQYLCGDPEGTHIKLALQQSMGTIIGYSNKLGSELDLYSIPLMDASRVHIVREAPLVDGTDPGMYSFAKYPPGFALPSRIDASADVAELKLDENSQTVETLTMRRDAVGKLKEQLSQASTAVKIEQTSPCEMQLRIGSNIQLLAFPYPIDGSHAKLRIARKSGWVEAIAPIAKPDLGGLPSKLFPVSRHSKWTSPWNVHRVNLSRSPVLDVTKIERLSWMQNQHLAYLYSDQERLVRNKLEVQDTKRYIKDSIRSMFLGMTGLGGANTWVYALDPTNGTGLTALFFFTAIRLDLANHTIVADGYVLPLDAMTDYIVGRDIDAMVEEIGQLPCPSEEIIAWQHLIPAFTERCRDYPHKSDCAYLRTGRIPLSAQFHQIPICNCGRGKVCEDFKKHQEWRVFTPFVTRICVSLLFAVPYMAPIAKNLGGMFKAEDAREMRELEQKVANILLEKSRTASPRCEYCKHDLSANQVLVCSGCKKARYCNRICQTDDWKKHKKDCRK